MSETPLNGRDIKSMDKKSETDDGSKSGKSENPPLPTSTVPTVNIEPVNTSVVKNEPLISPTLTYDKSTALVKQESSAQPSFDSAAYLHFYKQDLQSCLRPPPPPPPLAISAIAPTEVANFSHYDEQHFNYPPPPPPPTLPPERLRYASHFAQQLANVLQPPTPTEAVLPPENLADVSKFMAQIIQDLVQPKPPVSGSTVASLATPLPSENLTYFCAQLIKSIARPPPERFAVATPPTTSPESLSYFCAHLYGQNLMPTPPPEQLTLAANAPRSISDRQANTYVYEQLFAYFMRQLTSPFAHGTFPTLPYEAPVASRVPGPSRLEPPPFPVRTLCPAPVMLMERSRTTPIVHQSSTMPIPVRVGLSTNVHTDCSSLPPHVNSPPRKKSRWE